MALTSCLASARALNRPEESTAAFDDEGFYCVGDAVTFMDAADPARGLRFHGRVSESFKLSNGTWVVAGELRLKLLNATEGLFQDLVIAGENRDRIAVMGWVSPERARPFLNDPRGVADPAQLAEDPGLRAHLRKMFMAHNASVGSSERVSAFTLLRDPPSLAIGEITDKASINQRMVLKNRAEIVDALYLDVPSAAAAKVV